MSSKGNQKEKELRDSLIADLDALLGDGNTGFYRSCEVTQLFISRKTDKAILNFFIIAVFEDKPFHARNHQFLTSGKGIKIDDNHKLCIQRYWLSIDEAKNVFLKLQADNKWQFENDETLQIEPLNLLSKQFIPSREGNRVNNVLKNNFHGGSYILEFFDETKRNLEFLLDLKKVKQLNTLSVSIESHVPIDLSVARDRIGNVIFQFPITVLRSSSKALKSWNGVRTFFQWNSQVTTVPECFIQVESTLDNNYMGSSIVEYNRTAVHDIVSGSLDQISHIKVWRKEPNLLLATFDGTYMREMVLNAGIINHEPRIFSVDGIEQKVQVSGKGMRSGSKDQVKYTTYINNTLYDQEKSRLERDLSFKQYFNGSHESAISDVRNLISKNDENGAYIWDPYLRASDIFKTLFYSLTSGVPLKAIGSIDKGTKKVYEDSGKTTDQIILEQRQLLDNPGHNNFGLNLEFRIQYDSYGWSFHDRFLIFPGSKYKRPKVFSLGTSVNSVGQSHHIIQEVSHPQRVIDAFDELWERMKDEKCLVWKYPKKS